MMPTLLFKICLGYQLQQYIPLINKAVYKLYNKQSKKYEWVFNVSDLDFVTKELGKPITFETSECEIERLIKLCPPLKSKVVTEQWKGKGELTVIAEPELFLVGEWQKDPKTGEPKQSWQRIPRQNVIVAFDAMKDYPINKYIKTMTIAENICRRLNFKRFFRNSGTWDKDKWTGAHRTGHLPYCYYPLKILHWLGAVDYKRAGMAARLKDKLTFQTGFKRE